MFDSLPFGIARFVERIEECDELIPEWDLAGIRLVASEAKKETVLPVLLAGEESEAIPALLRGRGYADFRKPEDYFSTALDLLLSLFAITPQKPVTVELRNSLAGRTQ